MSVAVTTVGESVNLGAPMRLFAASLRPGEGEYAVSSTGRFLLNVPSTETAPVPLTVILNWAAGLKNAK